LEGKRLIDVLADKHKDWHNMAKSFGCNDEDAHELVQEMYIRITKYVEDKDKIMYNEKEVNTYYIYVTLRNLYLSGFHLNMKKKHLPINDSIDFEYITIDIDKESSFNNLVDKIDSLVSSWYWYDKKIWDIHFYNKMSMRQIAKATKISLSSIFNTLSNGKEEIREKTIEDYKEYSKIK